MYATILSVLLEPHSTAHATAQFRFWAKRMFRLVTTPHANLVAHENRPVAVKDQIYHSKPEMSLSAALLGSGILLVVSSGGSCH